MIAPRVCPYCAVGNKRDENGEHWIVKSIIPAEIDIRKCPAFSAVGDRENDATGKAGA